MKAPLVLGLLILAILIAVLLHAHKIRQNRQDQQLIFSSLQHIKGMIPPDETIYVRIETGQQEAGLYARYALAPFHTEFLQPNKEADTFLVLSLAGNTDSSVSINRVLWENQDEHYRYRLLSKR